MIGIDISRHQGEVNWDVIKEECDFAIIRSSFGTGNKDSQFDRNRDEARRVGIPRGFYHYAYSEVNSPEAEANWFCDVVGEPQAGELMVLDYESDWDGDQVDWCHRFLSTIENRLNYKAMIYMDWARTKSADWSIILDHPLWLARWDYSSMAPAPSTQWSDVPLRQYSNSGNIAGISPCDMNVFYGDQNQFNNYGYKGNQMTYTEYENEFNNLTDADKHREAVTWAFRSIYLKEPTKAKIDYIIAQPNGGDIIKVRQGMLDEVCKCPEDLSLELAEAKQREKENWDNFIKVQDERDKAETKLKACLEADCICSGPEAAPVEMCQGKEAKKLFWNLWWVK